jgi:hypothetical protein
MGLKFEYPRDFDRIWSEHPVGVKKAAFDAWTKQKFTPDENAELIMYLRRRHKDDRKWVEGKYIPHLATFLNQRRWEDDYEKVKKHWTQARREEQVAAEERGPRPDPEQVRQMLAQAFRTVTH